MKRIFILVLLILIIGTVSGEKLITTQNSPTSEDIKEIVNADLIRPFQEDYFIVNSSELPKFSNPKKGIPETPFLSFEVSDKKINIKPDSLTVDGMLIKPTEYTMYMPYTNYFLSQNLRIWQMEDYLILQDDTFNIATEEINVEKGIVYLHKNKLPIKIMPYMITYEIRKLTRDEVTDMTIFVEEDELKYSLKAPATGKLFYLFDKNMKIKIIIDGFKGTMRYDKPWYALFTVGETDKFDNIDLEEFKAF